MDATHSDTRTMRAMRGRLALVAGTHMNASVSDEVELATITQLITDLLHRGDLVMEHGGMRALCDAQRVFAREKWAGQVEQPSLFTGAA